MRFLYIASMLILLQANTTTNAADIYKCADKQGHIAYIQLPCDTQNLKTLHIIKTPDTIEPTASAPINSSGTPEEIPFSGEIQWSSQEQISVYKTYPMSKKEHMCKIYADTVSALDNKIYRRSGTTTASYKVSNLLSQRETYNRLLAMDCGRSSTRVYDDKLEASERKTKNIKLSAAIFVQ